MANNFSDNGEIVWQPDQDGLEQTHMSRFMKAAGAATGQPFADYQALYRWSVESPVAFWSEFAEYADIGFSRKPDHILENPESMLSARWFSGARLNFAEQLLRGPDDPIVLVGLNEGGRRRELSRVELRAQTMSLATELRRLGVSKGDRVAALLPNCPEAVIAFLASASLGAVFSSCSPDFGLQGVLDRFGQIEPVVLFGCDGYLYSGKRIDCQARLVELQKQLPGLQHVIVVSILGDELATAAIPNAVPFDSLVGSTPADEGFMQVEFDHPLVILYSSGTTGKPKCIVHGSGGTLVQHLKELLLHTDLSASDTLFYFTTCGWMMWNWLVSGLATGARILLYDGSPSYPDIGCLWRIAEEEAITVFGTSPSFLTSCNKTGLKLSGEFGLKKLRTILSTGSPLAPQNFDYVRREFNGRIQISSISGGTDIISCFALGNPLLPVYRGELQCAGLGMAIDVYDKDANSLSCESGELVCTRPFPSMPTGFWNDPDNEKYSAAYFAQFPGTWAHGDIAETTVNHGLIIHGRSDAVLNPSGVRIGTAEIYNPVLSLREVTDCVAIGQDWQGDVRIVLFVVLADGVQLREIMVKRIRDAIRLNASPRHVPKLILQVFDVPRTRSGKIVELAVRSAVHGRPVDNLEAIANPAALDEFRNRAELE